MLPLLQTSSLHPRCPPRELYSATQTLINLPPPRYTQIHYYTTPSTNPPYSIYINYQQPSLNGLSIPSWHYGGFGVPEEESEGREVEVGGLLVWFWVG
jgi:hypothetical protein